MQKLDLWKVAGVHRPKTFTGYRKRVKLAEDLANEAIVEILKTNKKIDYTPIQVSPERKQEISMMQIFLDTMKRLEGENKDAVSVLKLIQELVKTGKFTEDLATKYIIKLRNEAAIYESKPMHYNRV